MSVNYSSVSLIGVDFDEVDYSTLTEHAKILVMEEFKETEDYEDIEKEYLNDDCEWIEDPTEIIYDAIVAYFNENMHGILDDWFNGVALIGNCFSGHFESIGVDVNLYINGTYEDEIRKFKKFINLEPQLRSGVYVW